LNFNNLNSEQYLLLLWVIFSLFIGIAISIDLGILGKIRSYLIKNKKKENGNQNSNMLVSSISPPPPPPSYLQSKKQMEKGRLQPETTFKQALIWTMVWTSLAGVFAGIIYAGMGYDKLLAFVTGYTVEKSLSIDNMFVFLLIFSSLGIPHIYQHKVLSVGILSAIAMRIPLILVGVSLLEIFNWMVYIFGGLLLFTAIQMLVQKKEKKIVEIENNIAVRILKKVIPLTSALKDNKFFSHQNGILYATPMLVALVIVEMTDLVFAIDSIPAILAITTDSFIIITSNIFAILGLRSLYLLIAGLMYKFYYLKPGLIALLFFIGFKMVLSEFYKIPLSISLVIILGILSIAMVLSFIKTRQPYEKIHSK
jgi:tellurite resistance protein TerC